jgi:creatine kinase
MGCKSNSSVGGPEKKGASGPYETDAMKKMPDWIKVGCGDAPYYCEEKNAVFGGNNSTVPDKLPDLSKHANFMTDFMKANPGVYD